MTCCLIILTLGLSFATNEFKQWPSGLFFLLSSCVLLDDLTMFVELPLVTWVDPVLSLFNTLLEVLSSWLAVGALSIAWGHLSSIMVAYLFSKVCIVGSSRIAIWWSLSFAMFKTLRMTFFDSWPAWSVAGMLEIYDALIDGRCSFVAFASSNSFSAEALLVTCLSRVLYTQFLWAIFVFKFLCCDRKVRAERVFT